jgi:hypothetical protein
MVSSTFVVGLAEVLTTAPGVVNELPVFFSLEFFVEVTALPLFYVLIGLMLMPAVSPF